jgi:RNA polymerase sigma factor (sigma-70 family)
MQLHHPTSPAETDPTEDSQRAFLVLLFNKYRAALVRHLERLVGSREDAAELAQETYLRVMRQVQTSRFEAAARSYLFQTATNLARDHHRRQRFRAHDRLDEIPETDLSSAGPLPEQSVDAEQALGRLRTAIDGLPPVTRSVFLRARVENQSYGDIGRSLSLSTRTVERRVAEAMQALTAALGERS